MHKEVNQYDEKSLNRIPLMNIYEPHKKYTEKEEKYLREMRVYQFSNLEQAGSPLEFSYGSGKVQMQFKLEPNTLHRLPRWLAQHVESRGRPVYDWVPTGESRKMTKRLVDFERRFMMREVAA